MSPRQFILSTALITAAAHAGPPEPHADILLARESDQIVTGEIDLRSGDFTTGIRVFGAELGEDGVPFATTDPGFNSLDGTWAPGSHLGFDLLATLRVWNGSGFDPAAEETMTVSFLVLSATTGRGFVPGFDLTVPEDGGIHAHFDFTLNGSGGDPAPGVYLLELAYRSDDGVTAPSLPFWIVFNESQSEEEHDAAIAWVEANLANPACIGDIDADGERGFSDVLLVLSSWGPCAGCAADVDGDDVVGFADLLQILSNWGPCS